MLTGALIAFGHFLAFFTLTAAIVLKLALIGDAMSADLARRVIRADRVAGLSAAAILIFGTLRVLYFEKGVEYYGDNLFFQIKIGLFLLAALISIYPTTRFLGWKHELNKGQSPVVTPDQLKKLKRALHWELVLVMGILLCASLMARGFGS